MLFLAFDAAVSNRFACGTCLQFDVINFCGAAGGTTHHHVGLSLYICAHRQMYAPVVVGNNDNDIASYKELLQLFNRAAKAE